MELNEKQIRYLLTILKYSKEDEVRSVDIARDMNDSKPVAHGKLETLIELGLITKKKYRNIKFTDEGHEITLRLSEKFEVMTDFFISEIGLEQEDAQISAYKMLGNFSKKCVENFCSYASSLCPINHNQDCAL